MQSKKKQKARHSSSRDRKEVRVHAPVKIRQIVDKKEVKTEIGEPKSKKDVTKKDVKATKDLVKTPIKEKTTRKDDSSLQKDEYPKHGDEWSDVEHQDFPNFDGKKVKNLQVKGGAKEGTIIMSSSSECSDDD